MKSRAPWVFRLPRGLREQPAWIFIGTLVALAGMSYLLGVSESTTVTKAVGPGWLRMWGGFLCLSGGLVVWSMISANLPLQKLALRFMGLSLLLYMGWILLVVPVSKATLTIVLCVCLTGMAEIRIAVIKALLIPLPTNDREAD